MWNSLSIYVLTKTSNTKNSSDKETVKYGYLYKKLCQVVEGTRHDSCTVRPQSVNLGTLDHRNCRNISVSETESSE